MRRTTFAKTLAAVVAASAVATTPALARPLDPGYGGHSRPDPDTSAQSQHLFYHQQTAEPTWPAHPRGGDFAATPLPSHASGGDDTIWIIGLAAGAVAAGLSAAGLSHHSRRLIRVRP